VGFDSAGGGDAQAARTALVAALAVPTENTRRK
jgi:hypothetical protein